MHDTLNFDKPLKGGPTQEQAVELDYTEGVIFVSPGGSWYENQAGGLACRTQTGQGLFLACVIPAVVKAAVTGVPYPVEFIDHDAVDAAFDMVGLTDWRSDRSATDSMEAWLCVLAAGEPAIMVWTNSD